LFGKKRKEPGEPRPQKAAEAVLTMMARAPVDEYVNYLASPKRILWSNALAGFARGLGFALGLALLGAIVLPFLRRLDWSHIPLLGDLARELARLLESRLIRP